MWEGKSSLTNENAMGEIFKPIRAHHSKVIMNISILYIQISDHQTVKQIDDTHSTHRQSFSFFILHYNNCFIVELIFNCHKVIFLVHFVGLHS